MAFLFLTSVYSVYLLISVCMYFITRQTSDPRSGFATVEKDFPGGLTPMLGDRKVSNTTFCDIIIVYVVCMCTSRMLNFSLLVLWI